LFDEVVVTGGARVLLVLTVVFEATVVVLPPSVVTVPSDVVVVDSSVVVGSIDVVGATVVVVVSGQRRSVHRNPRDPGASGEDT
jgi:hypothetical protein